ncbi:proteasome regulatory particle lid subunit [Pichia kluyveri]|uniref:Proteasome regulatory particle lid subunit n=1 Tax=Pichia kluyveri TaxID=36015 RepID=A0AAV5RAR0_PICKL|nr:proteasome regulatory particle lid subunit [Pichia kluyveri]
MTSVEEPAITEIKEKSVLQQLESFLPLITNSVAKFDPRYVLRVFRQHAAIRREIKADDLLDLINKTYPTTFPTVENLVGALTPFSKKISKTDTDVDMDSDDHTVTEVSPEIDVFVHLMVQIYLYDIGEIKALYAFNKNVIELLKKYNRRTLDYIQAKAWYYIFRSSEIAKDLINIRADLMNALRTATLSHDTETRASVITLLLRNYILTNDINQAYNLVEKIEFPFEATTSIVARYHYYLAKIQTIQLDYSSANECIITAIRKCPQTKNAKGFLQSATKLQILIQLLTGEIPELSQFDDPILFKSLRPYAEVTKAVRLGDLKIFNNALKTYGDHLKNDKNYNLVLRLRENVIKTGIRIISLSYKRISLKDICIKLHLDNELTAEYIVAKAIKDGVVDISINHTKGYIESLDVSDVYTTKAPQAEFDRRIKFCMQLNNDSVKAMRYPMTTGREKFDDDNEARQREQELLQFLQEEDF